MRGIFVVLGIIIGMILMYRWLSRPISNITSDGFSSGKKDLGSKDPLDS